MPPWRELFDCDIQKKSAISPYFNFHNLITSDVGPLTFFCFLNSTETLSNSSEVSRICLFRSVSEKLNCAENEQTKSLLEFHQLFNLTNKDFENTKNNCSQHGISIENDYVLAKLMASPNPLSLAVHQNLKLDLLKGELDQCEIRFKMFDLNGKELSIGDKFYNLPGEIELSKTSLSEGVYSLLPIEAKCDERIITLPTLNAIKLIIQM